MSVWTYKRNGEAQIQLPALERLQHYLDLAVKYPDLASRDESQSVDVRYAWFAALSLTTAQTLWLHVGRQPTWQRSINAIVRQHHSYLRSGDSCVMTSAPISSTICERGWRIASAQNRTTRKGLG